MSRIHTQIMATITAVVTVLFSVSLLANPSPFAGLSEDDRLSEGILRELVGFETTHERPDEVKRSLEAMAVRLLQAGFPEEDVQLVEPDAGLHGMVVRLRGIAGPRPVLLLAHIDVVTATPDAWAFPPFSLGKKEGYYVGRGTSDNKTGVTQIISNFIRLKKEGWVPGRDVIAAITGDEETNGAMAAWFANEGRHLVDAEYAINTDAGGGEYDENGQRRAFWVQTSEKLYQSYELTATNEGGHSSLPRPDNAIVDLAVAITRLSEHQFPVILNEGARLGLRRASGLYPESISLDMLRLADDQGDVEAGQRLSDYDPGFNAVLRTTCVPTMLRGGHAENALPRDATVTVNCRILPGTKPSEIMAEISRLTTDLDIRITAIYDGLPSPASDLPAAFLESVESLVNKRYGDVPVIPSMSTGATDGLFYRNAGMPVFGMGALFSKPSDERAHGLDERVGVADFHESVAFWYDLIKQVAQ